MKVKAYNALVQRFSNLHPFITLVTSRVVIEMNPATGQPDYSEQWAAYYRQMGWHEQADSILKNAANGGGAGQTQTSQAQQ